MKGLTLEARTWFVRSAIVLAFSLCAAHSPAHASVLYDFSLPANGAVGAIDIQVTFPDFLPDAGLFVLGLTDAPVTSVTGAPPIDLANSVIGIDIDAGTTLIGVRLVDFSAEVISYNFIYPADFFVFSRTPLEAGAFNSTSGTLVSDYALDTTTPTAMLTVTQVPEPASALLLGLGLAGMAGLRRFRAYSGRRTTATA